MANEEVLWPQTDGSTSETCLYCISGVLGRTCLPEKVDVQHVAVSAGLGCKADKMCL